MENRARYVLVGLFTLAVLAAGFAFTYWLNTTGALQQRSYYRIRYQNSVAGLLVGSAVQFNGVRVGEVAALDLNPSNPKEVTVTIAVTPAVPVRVDTKAGIAFQGLMGAPAVSLSGGSGAPLLSTTLSEGAPVLAAEPNAGETMSEVALSALHRVDSVVSENAEPLKNTIANLSKFTDALARNSDRVDSIVAGIERMTGGAKTQNAVFELAAAETFPKFEKPALGLLVVQYPTASSTLGQDKILVRDGSELKPFAPEAKWSDMLLEEVQSSFVQSFENAGFLGQVSRPVDGMTADFQLVTDIRNFQILAGAPAAADVEFSAKILNSEGHVVGARLFHANSPPLHSEDAVGAASALDAAFGSMLPDLVVWTSTTIGNVASAPH